jgi:hypothetical protein
MAAQPPRLAAERLPAEAHAPGAAWAPAAGLLQLDCATQLEASEREVRTVELRASPEWFALEKPGQRALKLPAPE